MRLFLKIAAWFFKIAAILFWLGMVCVKAGLGDWGTQGFYHQTYLEIAILGLLFLLAVLPNRWLVSPLIAFIMTLLIALIPFCLLISSLRVFSDLFWAAPLIVFFSLLPLSLIFSFCRQRKGEKVGYV
jgi:hypothetical protein